ncbi:MAG: aldo/keto reductase, partial [Candidatus Methylomirabilales bacterium]
MRRRDFLKTGLAWGMASQWNPTRGESAILPKRPYREGVELSIIGFGGIVVVGLEQKEANRIVAEAIERGVN